MSSSELRKALDDLQELLDVATIRYTRDQPNPSPAIPYEVVFACEQWTRVLNQGERVRAAALALATGAQPTTPVDEPVNDERAYGCYGCGKQGLKKGQRISLVFCNACDSKYIEAVRMAEAKPKPGICVCGHPRTGHGEEPPYACNFLVEGVDCEDDDYCECRGFTYAPVERGRSQEKGESR